MKKSKLAFSLIEISIVILIIGILVVGITKGSRILSSSKLSSAKSLTAGSPVNLHAHNLVFWIDASSDKSLSSSQMINGAAVTLWNDMNPAAQNGGFNFTSAGTNPIFVSNSANGLPGVKFDNSLMRNINVPGSALSEGGNQMTAFIVQKDITVPTQVFASTIMWQSPPNRIGMHATTDTGVFYYDFGVCCGADARVNFTPPTSFNNRTNIITVARRPNSTMLVRINGAYFINPTSATGKTSLVNGTVVTNFNLGDDSMRGEVNEIIFFKTGLQDAEIIAVEKYLSNKWGVALKGLN